MKNTVALGMTKTGKMVTVRAFDFHFTLRQEDQRKRYMSRLLPVK